MNSVQTIGFGAGFVLASPKSGDLAPNPSPTMVSASIQNWKATISGDIKELFGQNQFAIDSAVGKRSIKGSFEYGSFTLEMLNQLYLADSLVTGSIHTAVLEPHTIAATTPFIVTATHSATFVQDFGVFYAVTGAPLELVASAPATGQYMVSAGVYTFASVDEGLAAQISYSYGDTTTGKTLTVSTRQMGYGPIISLMLTLPYKGSNCALFLPNCRLGKIDLSTKLDDYATISTDFHAFAGTDGIVAQMYAMA